MSDSDYTDVITTTTAEFPALFLVIILIDKLGRKLCIGIQFGLAFLSTVALLVCSSRGVVVALIFIARGSLASTFQTVYLYTSEVYPTNVRSVGLGFCSMTARFGSIVTPFVAQVVFNESFHLVIAMYGVPLLLSVVAAYLLKNETNQMPLEDSPNIELTPCSENYQTFD